MKVYAFSGLHNSGGTHLLGIYPTREAGVEKLLSNPNCERFYKMCGEGPLGYMNSPFTISIREISDALFEIVCTPDDPSKSAVLAHIICLAFDLDIEDPKSDDTLVEALDHRNINN